MNEVIDKLLRLKTIAKVGITGAVMLLIALAYNVLFYSDLGDEIKNGKTAQEALKTERTSYEKRRAEYLVYRNELTQLQEEQREILKVLPRKAEIPSLISSIEDQAGLSGLVVASMTIEAEIPEDLYVKIPVRLELQGTYHAITKFFKNISEIKRIINVENLSLIPDVSPAATAAGGPTKLRAKFVAATFRFQDDPGSVPKKGTK